jgi:hypothetical protein
MQLLVSAISSLNVKFADISRTYIIPQNDLPSILHSHISNGDFDEFERKCDALNWLVSKEKNRLVFYTNTLGEKVIYTVDFKFNVIQIFGRKFHIGYDPQVIKNVKTLTKFMHFVYAKTTTDMCDAASIPTQCIPIFVPGEDVHRPSDHAIMKMIAVMISIICTGNVMVEMVLIPSYDQRIRLWKTSKFSDKRIPRKNEVSSTTTADFKIQRDIHVENELWCGFHIRAVKSPFIKSRDWHSISRKNLMAELDHSLLDGLRTLYIPCDYDTFILEKIKKTIASECLLISYIIDSVGENSRILGGSIKPELIFDVTQENLIFSALFATHITNNDTVINTKEPSRMYDISIISDAMQYPSQSDAIYLVSPNKCMDSTSDLILNTFLYGLSFRIDQEDIDLYGYRKFGDLFNVFSNKNLKTIKFFFTDKAYDTIDRKMIFTCDSMVIVLVSFDLIGNVICVTYETTNVWVSEWLKSFDGQNMGDFFGGPFETTKSYSPIKIKRVFYI